MSTPRDRDSFPRQHARTRRFELGQPRTFTVAGDGSRVLFLRSEAGDDPLTSLWCFDVERGEELLLADPRTIERGDVPEEERALRERTREHAEGVVAYSADREARTAVFALGGGLFVLHTGGGRPRRLAAAEPVVDPRIDPTGRRVAYVAGGRLRVIDLEEGDDRELAGEEDPDVSWGLAEFVAAEEMDRHHGFWWSPDGERIAVARVDERDVPVWHIANPIDPAAPPRAVRYPAAGTTNADVALHVVGLDGARVEVAWDRAAFEYLARVVWAESGPLTLQVQSRDQRTSRIVTAADDGTTEVVREDSDPAWVELVDGSPARLDDGRLVCTADLDDTRRLVVGEEPVTPPGLQVRRIVDADADVLFTASDDPLEVHVWRWSPDGGPVRLTDTPGVHDAARGGHTIVLASAALEGDPTFTVRMGDETVGALASRAEQPLVDPRPTLFVAGSRDLRCALLLPGGREPDGPLPVLLDPYGGPHFQRVTRSRAQFLESQWLADQGFAVLVADGRGTPGRGPAWDREVLGRLLEVPLEDQVDALHAAAERFGFLDLSRVAIRGWSFGGELAAAAVLRRPDVFHAAVVGAPATDQALYDTHYTERYLGHPKEEPEAYRRASLLDDAPTLSRPMLLVHGMTDDNCFVAHSLRLSRALLEAGRPHMFLPLSGITHMPIQEEVAENLLLLQVRFLRDALGDR